MKISVRKDVLWKSIIEDLAEDFLALFFSSYTHLMDLKKPISFLDKELEALDPENGAGSRRVDKLLQVTAKEGHPFYFLIHVEVQGYDDANFGWRMFQYAYRLIDKYGVNITSLAIFISKNKKYHISSFQYDQWGTSIDFKYNTYCLIDQSPASFDKSKNAFAIILEMAWYDLQKLNDAALFKAKKRLINKLTQAGYDSEKIKFLLNFIRSYTLFDREENLVKFEEVVLKNYSNMSIEEAIKKDIAEQAFEMGKEEGQAILIHNLIRRAKKKGYSFEQMCETYNLSAQELKSILAEID